MVTNQPADVIHADRPTLRRRIRGTGELTYETGHPRRFSWWTHAATLSRPVIELSMKRRHRSRIRQSLFHTCRMVAAANESQRIVIQAL
jgi:hypothetical protein